MFHNFSDPISSSEEWIMIASNHKVGGRSSKTMESPQNTTRYISNIQPVVAGNGIMVLTVAAQDRCRRKSRQ